MDNISKIRDLEREIKILSLCLAESNQIEVRRHLELRLDERKLEYEERTGKKYEGLDYTSPR